MKREIQLLIATAVTSFAIGASDSLSLAAPQAQMCGGDKILNDHSIDGYHFATTSWVRSEKNAQIYRTCVENRAKDKSVWIDWRIPGPRTYIAPQDSAVSERPFSTRKPADLATCLIYGSYRKSIKEQYLAHDSDVSRAAQEGDCSKLGTAVTQVQLDFTEPFFGEIEGRAAVPSDLDDVEGTLIRFVFKVALHQASYGYDISFGYEAGPASAESKGNLSEISLVLGPRIRELNLKKIERLSLDGSSSIITLPMALSQPFTLATDSYYFLDRKGRLATEIQVPVLLPVQPR